MSALTNPRAGGLGLCDGPARLCRGYLRGEAANGARKLASTRLRVVEPTGPPSPELKWLDGQAVAAWLRDLGAYSTVTGWRRSDLQRRRVLSNRLIRWNHGDCKASERTLDRMLGELGLSLHDVPSRLYLDASKTKAARKRPSTYQSNTTPAGVRSAAG